MKKGEKYIKKLLVYIYIKFLLQSIFCKPEGKTDK